MQRKLTGQVSASSWRICGSTMVVDHGARLSSRVCPEVAPVVLRMLFPPALAKVFVMNLFTPRRRPATLRQALRDGVIAALSIAAGGALGFACTTLAIDNGLVAGLTIDSLPPPSADSPVTASVSVAEESRALAEAHECWTGSDDMPADMSGEFPGHVVVTRADSEGPTYSAALVGPALDQVFGEAEDTGLTVHAFCR